MTSKLFIVGLIIIVKFIYGTPPAFNASVCDLNDWIQRYNERTEIIGWDFNTDLDKSNPASDLLNRFIKDYKFERCDTLQTNGQKRFTFFNDVQGDQSQIDF